ncbi:MAG: S8 family peptidase [Burkholderiales bacterium]|nr:S8 family peptidase [Burkholderiales bacterium]
MFAARPFFRIVAATLALVAGAPGVMAAQDTGREARPFAESTPIAGRYIVLFRKDRGTNPGAEATRARSQGARVNHVYTRAVHGFAAEMPDALAAALRQHPDVELVEQDATVSINFAQSPATWGLDRIDQADRPLDTIYQYTATGLGVTAFVIDTGINSGHTEFSGRMESGYTAISDGRGTQDCNGHGTHVAGTVGGTTWGVAKEVTLVPVRVLDCRGSGTWSQVIAGIDWVANHAARPAVANMSLGGGKSTAVNNAVAGAVQKGVTMAVAAGNDNRDACNYSPASTPSAITVGATTSSDARATYSNYGACVDIFAPGSSIKSAWYTSPTATNTISGTSMATPHVAGVAALVLQANPGATPAAVANFLVSNATSGRVTSTGSGSPNRLLYSLATGTPEEPVPQVVAVSGLAGVAQRISSRQWRATVTISVRDLGANAAAANVSVSGTFLPGGTASCMTTSSGSCSVSVTLDARNQGSTRFTVGTLSGTNMVYDATQNSASQITVNKP